MYYVAKSDLTVNWSVDAAKRQRGKPVLFRGLLCNAEGRPEQDSCRETGKSPIELQQVNCLSWQFNSEIE